MSFAGKKTKSVAVMRFDKEVTGIRGICRERSLFPFCWTGRAGDRSTEFHQSVALVWASKASPLFDHVLGSNRRRRESHASIEPELVMLFAQPLFEIFSA